MKKLLAAAAVAALFAAPSARAADRTGFLLGARAAYAWPMGDATGAYKLDKLVDRAWPFWLELNYRFGPSFELGAYGQYAIADFSSAYGGKQGSDLRAGLQLNYIFAPGAPLTPWLGIGGGYEWLKADTRFDIGNASGSLSSSTWKGWDVMVQAGADLHAGDRFTIGPFAAMTFGRFGSRSLGDIESQLRNASDQAWHEWLQVGVRATFF